MNFQECVDNLLVVVDHQNVKHRDLRWKKMLIIVGMRL